MRTKIRFTAVILLLSIISTNANAQIQRFGWYGNPVVKLDNPIYTTAWSIGVPYLFQLFSNGNTNLNGNDVKAKMKLASFLYPRVGWKPNVVQKNGVCKRKGKNISKVAGL